jgi:hypothetical protein
MCLKLVHERIDMLCYPTGTAYIFAAKFPIILGSKSYPCPIGSTERDGRQTREGQL